MKVRQGRKNPRNLYFQVGDEPHDGDPCLGLIIDPVVARILLEAVTEEVDLADLREAVGERA